VSERGSFVTEYIYGFRKNNEEIHWNLKKIFRDYWNICTDIADGTIIVGKTTCGYPGGEFIEFETDIIPLIQKQLPAGDTIRIAILSDTSGEAIYLINKNYVKSHRLDITDQRENDVRCL
jgi:hypothetical protein